MSSSSKAIAAGALMILICIGMLSFWSEVRNEKDREWVIHTLLVVERLQAIRIDITQAETGQRGFLLTGQDRYLEPYRAGVDKLRADAGALKYLTWDNIEQAQALQRLEPLIAARLAELADGIEVRKHSGLLAGVGAVSSGNDGDLWTGLIAAHIAEMRRTDAELLSRRLETAATSTRKIKAIIVFGNALAILILLTNGLVIHREIGRRNLAEDNFKRANEQLKHQAKELMETNVELESFTYSVAHDLRAPLRHIAGYANIMDLDYGAQLDAEGRRYLTKIVDGAQKMGHLVDYLLGLSKIGQQVLSWRDTTIDSLVSEVLEELAPEYSGRQIEWRIGPLPTIACDPGLMKQVFVNLLSNAVKYTGKQEHAVIEVGQTRHNGENIFFVRDNGAGFEMQYVGKLFGVFQRLHSARDFEGTGVGLAITQRIISRHGGRIWAEGAPGQGATFSFTLGSREIILAKEAEVTPEFSVDERGVACRTKLKFCWWMTARKMWS